MGEIAKDTKTRLLEVFYAVYEKDARKVMAELVGLGALVPTGDQTAVSDVMNDVSLCDVSLRQFLRTSKKQPKLPTSARSCRLCRRPDRRE